MIFNTLTSLLLLASQDQHRCFKSLSFSPHLFSSCYIKCIQIIHPPFFSPPLLLIPVYSFLYLMCPCSSFHLLCLFFTSFCLPLLTPIFQFSCVLALCSASSHPPLSWRQSISQVHGARTHCRLVTDCMSCRGLHIGQKCCMSMPPGMIIAKIESLQPISESWGVCNTIRVK